MSLSGALFVVHAVICGVAYANGNFGAALFLGIAAFLASCYALNNDEKKEHKIDRLEKKLGQKEKDGGSNGG